jgi:hypothetical protein
MSNSKSTSVKDEGADTSATVEAAPTVSKKSESKLRSGKSSAESPDEAEQRRKLKLPNYVKVYLASRFNQEKTAGSLTSAPLASVAPASDAATVARVSASDAATVAPDTEAAVSDEATVAPATEVPASVTLEQVTSQVVITPVEVKPEEPKSGDAHCPSPRTSDNL